MTRLHAPDLPPAKVPRQINVSDVEITPFIHKQFPGIRGLSATGYLQLMFSLAAKRALSEEFEPPPRKKLTVELTSDDWKKLARVVALLKGATYLDAVKILLRR